MTVSIALAATGAILIATGVYLFMERSLMRILAGLLSLSNGVSLLFLVSAGTPANAPFVTDGGSAETVTDPLPQAMVLTAIVISLATNIFLLALSYRSFQLDGHDEVADDVEDAIVRRRAEADLPSATFDEAEEGIDHDTDLDEAAEAEAQAAQAAAAAGDAPRSADAQRDGDA